MAHKITATGHVEEFSLLSADSLKALQEAVGGYIEMVTCADGRLMYVNEEGLLHNLPLNVTASELAGKHIVGDVIVLTLEETRKELHAE